MRRLTRVPRRHRLSPGEAGLRRRLTPPAARCSPGPYSEYFSLRPRTASAVRGTRGRCGLASLSCDVLWLGLFLAGAFEVAAGLGEEDVVERRLMQAQRVDAQTLGVEAAHDVCELSVAVDAHGHGA